MGAENRFGFSLSQFQNRTCWLIVPPTPLIKGGAVTRNFLRRPVHNTSATVIQGLAMTGCIKMPLTHLSAIALEKAYQAYVIQNAASWFGIAWMACPSCLPSMNLVGVLVVVNNENNYKASGKTSNITTKYFGLSTVYTWDWC